MSVIADFNLYHFSNCTETKDTACPQCVVSRASAGKMHPIRDREHRATFFYSLGIDPESVVSVAQTHSRIVYSAHSSEEFSSFPKGDGILTRNRHLIPCVTVADCMPIFLYDPVSGCFGVLHSGWKGTGIIQDALELAGREWSALPANFRVIFGPHIHSCCYTVDSERADYFRTNFGESCIQVDPERMQNGNRWAYRLSLAEANRNLCISLGISPGYIIDTGECTACNSIFGSNRREGVDSFTHMAALIMFPYAENEFVAY